VKDSVKDQEKLFELLTEGNSYFFLANKKRIANEADAKS
jgi:hypothetical protein